MNRKDPPDTGSPSPWLERLMSGFSKDSAQQVWLAGLGALARAQAEGSKAFETLAKEGAAWQKKTSSAAEQKFGDVAGRMSGLAGDVQAKAEQRWDKIEGLVEERTAKVLKRLGVPTAEDLKALTARIDQLEARLAARARPAAAKTAATSAAKAGARAAPRAATKKTAVKKPAAKAASSRRRAP